MKSPVGNHSTSRLGYQGTGLGWPSFPEVPMAMRPPAWAILLGRCLQPTECVTSSSSLGLWDNKGSVPVLLYSWGSRKQELQETGCYGFLEHKAIEIAFSQTRYYFFKKQNSVVLSYGELKREAFILILSVRH